MAYTPAQFRDLVVGRRDACVKFKDGKPRTDRQEALQFYRGDNLPIYGDSGDGLSTVVSRDTMEAIEGMMPPLVEPFVAGEDVVAFEPVEPQDEAGALQATEYVNHVFRRGNNPLRVAESALKDGLLFRLGVAKVVVEDEEVGAPEEFAGLEQIELDALKGLLQAQGREIAGDIAQDPETSLYSVTAAPPKVKRYRVHIVAPDEFLYEERLAALKEATFLGHSKTEQLGDLIAMGEGKEWEAKCRALKSGTPSEEQDNRFEDEDASSDDWKDEDLARPVHVDECYIRCDYDGDGVLSWRKVLLGGTDKVLLSDEPVDDHPFSAWTPVPVAHKLVGLSIFDLTKDVQMQKTAITREALNAIYLTNRPMREVLDGQVNMDDAMNPSVGGFVRVKQMGAINLLATGGENVLQNSLAFIEYLDGVREARTGVTRYNQGMDANSLNKTATGMNIIASNSQQRQRLVARHFAEFLVDVFEKLFALVVRHADEQEVATVTGKPFAPWPTEHDTNVSVGLGNNNKDQQVGHIMALLQLDEKIIGLQQGLNGPLLRAEHIHEKLKRLVEAMGLKGVDGYYADPMKDAEQAQQQPQPQEPPEDPLAEPRMKQETELAKAQIKRETDLEVAAMKQAAPVYDPSIVL